MKVSITALVAGLQKNMDDISARLPEGAIAESIAERVLKLDQKAPKHSGNIAAQKLEPDNGCMNSFGGCYNLRVNIPHFDNAFGPFLSPFLVMDKIESSKRLWADVANDNGPWLRDITNKKSKLPKCITGTKKAETDVASKVRSSTCLRG